MSTLTTGDMRALHALSRARLNADAIHLSCFGSTQLQRREQAGLARVYNSGKPPNWGITPSGRRVQHADVDRYALLTALEAANAYAARHHRPAAAPPSIHRGGCDDHRSLHLARQTAAIRASVADRQPQRPAVALVDRRSVVVRPGESSSGQDVERVTLVASFVQFHPYITSSWYWPQDTRVPGSIRGR